MRILALSSLLLVVRNSFGPILGNEVWMILYYKMEEKPLLV